MIVTCAAIQRAEQRLFDAGVEAEALMECAGSGCARAIRQFFPTPGRAMLFVGKGNNGGDALVIGRELRKAGWKIEARFASGPEEMTDLSRKKRAELGETSPSEESAPFVLIDGLLGIGARGPLRGRIAELAAEMNALRAAEHAITFAVDLPSGLDGDTGEPHAGAVVADVTLTISAVKSGLVADRALDHVGRLTLIPMPDIAGAIDGGDIDHGMFVTDTMWLRTRLPGRLFSHHKGQAGRVAIVAGSRGLTGAARLCAMGALRGGAGLVTVFVPESIYPIIAAAAPAEAMVRPFAGYKEVRGFSADVIAVGPGLGPEPFDEAGMLALMTDDPRPIVIDADALNLLSRARQPIDRFQPAGPRLLTPHPGEMARLLGAGASGERRSVAREFVDRLGLTLLYKGARTVIADRNQPLAINPTGHPALATGGVGDVLTGLCAALIDQGLPPFEAAAMGSWLIGRAAEIALARGEESAESLTAGVVAQYLGQAFQSIRAGDF